MRCVCELTNGVDTVEAEGTFSVGAVAIGAKVEQIAALLAVEGIDAARGGRVSGKRLVVDFKRFGVVNGLLDLRVKGWVRVINGWMKGVDAVDGAAQLVENGVGVVGEGGEGMWGYLCGKLIECGARRIKGQVANCFEAAQCGEGKIAFV